MSKYNNSADTAENQLRFISDTMCYAKWAQVSLHLTNGMTNSCYHPPLHKINIDNLRNNPSSLHNTDEKKQERKMMLAGERPPGCSYCWKIEDTGNRSDRIYRSGEDWAQNSRKDIIETLDTGDIAPRYVEVNFNQSCNFKCSYCGPQLSTAWEREIKDYGPYKINDESNQPGVHNDIKFLAKDGLMPLKVKSEYNPYIEAFWRWWPQLYKKLEMFRITGGEPLMDANTFKVLDYIYKNPSGYLEMSITSNFCPPKKDLMNKFIEKVKKLEEIQIWKDEERFNPGSGNHWYVNMALKNFALYVSLDSVGEQAEYIRNGLNYSEMQNNVLNFLDETHNTTLTFINTFNVLSVPNFKEFLQYILDLRKQFSKENQGIKYIPIHDPNYTHPDYEIAPRQRIHFDIPILRTPAWQSIQILPEEFDHYLEDAIDFMKANSNVDNFDGFYDHEIAKAERNLDLLKERTKISTDQMAIMRQNFQDFFRQHDLRRGTSLVKTFPELTTLFKKWM